jgi:predicted nucleic acid-binding protein
MKQNASFDASFWINSCVANMVTHVIDYFYLFVTDEVAGEIRYPLDVLQMRSRTATLFNEWLAQGKITLQNPKASVSWFQSGENAAIALAIEQDYFLLIDDANPYHLAKKAGLRVVGTSDFSVFLYDQGRITYDAATEALRQMQISKKQRRVAMMTLAELKRLKEG